MNKSTFFIADLHLGHKNILKYENRPFSNIYNQDVAIINNWNKVVKKEHYVYVLGDVCFYPKDKTRDIITKLNGRKILIMGNHDKGHSIKYWQDVGFEVVSKYPMCMENNIWISHEPMYLDNNTVYRNIYGHVHSKGVQNDKQYCVSVEMINYTPIRMDKIF